MKNPSPAQTYFQRCRELADAVESQLPAIQRAADWFAQSILADRMVQVFGSGHSRIMVEEMWPRYGSFPGFNPIGEVLLSFPNLGGGGKGQRPGRVPGERAGPAERQMAKFRARA